VVFEALGIGATGKTTCVCSLEEKAGAGGIRLPETISSGAAAAKEPCRSGRDHQRVNEKDMLRYYRAFDFQTDPSKQTVLSNLVTQTRGEKVLYALKQWIPEIRYHLPFALRSIGC